MTTKPFKLRRPTLLVILDGFGVNPSRVNNAVYEANTPNFDRYFARYPHTVLKASGRAAGLPDGQMGNSEVGHLTLGSGSVVRQDLTRINDAIADESFCENQVLLSALQRAREKNRPVHLTGLVSDGGVHSHIEHLFALLRMCGDQGVKPIVHMITDGRDTPPTAAKSYLGALQKMLLENNGCIASICGRYYAMDRDRRWDRTKLAFDAIVHGKGRNAASLQGAIEMAYQQGETDEFISPTILPACQPMQAGDEMIFFNFRNDRPRQIVASLCQDDFPLFDRGNFAPLNITTLTEYDALLEVPVAFPPERPVHTIGKIVSDHGLSQFHCAETEKYAHVTFFLNGGEEAPYPGEDRVMIPSPKVATYDQQPEMNAAAVADAVIDAIKSKQYAFIVVNFANGDMVGHTAVREAAIKAVETLDVEVSRVLEAAEQHEFSVVMTADHGNCDELVDPVTGEPHTQHSLYPVPFLLMDNEPWRLSTGGGLSAVAPTILQLMGIEKPENMTGCSLLIKPSEHMANNHYEGSAFPNLVDTLQEDQ